MNERQFYRKSSNLNQLRYMIPPQGYPDERQRHLKGTSQIMPTEPLDKLLPLYDEQLCIMQIIGKYESHKRPL